MHEFQCDSHEFLIGTSGFFYKDWKSAFYPEKLPATQFLEYYSNYFQALELNFSFYRDPDAKQIQSLIQKTQGKVAFSVKVHQAFTHGQGSEEDFVRFLQMLNPIQESGALKCVLFQFPFSFRPTTENWTRIDRLSQKLGDIKGVVEFRHSDWVQEKTFAFLEELNLGFCCVDQPALPYLMPPEIHTTSSISYVRFHGRNRTHWWNHKEGWQRYDYHYTATELKEWIPKIKKLRRLTETVMVFFNNHYQGQAVRNAQLLRAFLID